MQQIVFIVHVLAAICLVALVLLQQGKGANVGAAFGSGASQTMFGSAGSLPFLVKVTAILATIFFITSLTLGYMTAREAKNAKQFSLSSLITQQTVPLPATKSG
jgi:preprotein translocase subunit SecG